MQKVFTKIINMPNRKAWVQRPSKSKKCKEAQALLEEISLIKVENVS
jgi:hypothetical protein